MGLFGEDRMNLDKAYEALAWLLNTIESTGGVLRNKAGHLLPVADTEWIDLGEAYKLACEALGRQMMVEPDTGDTSLEDEDGRTKET